MFSLLFGLGLLVDYEEKKNKKAEENKVSFFSRYIFIGRESGRVRQRSLAQLPETATDDVSEVRGWEHAGKGKKKKEPENYYRLPTLHLAPLFARDHL